MNEKHGERGGGYGEWRGTGGGRRAMRRRRRNRGKQAEEHGERGTWRKRNMEEHGERVGRTWRKRNMEKKEEDGE